VVRNVIIFYGEELLAPRPNLKLEIHPLSAVRDCLFNAFAATLRIRRPFFRQQPVDAPCRVDRDRLIMGCGIAMIITYSECASVSFVIQHGMRLRRVILSSVASLAVR
jgi:hypothetical protein